MTLFDKLKSGARLGVESTPKGAFEIQCTTVEGGLKLDFFEVGATVPSKTRTLETEDDLRAWLASEEQNHLRERLPPKAKKTKADKTAPGKKGAKK